MMPKMESRADRKSKLFIMDEINKMSGYAEMLENIGNFPAEDAFNWIKMIKNSASAILEEIDEMEWRKENK